jgi:gamma-glutamyltranspeptidase/glutathione hydrolase
MTLATRRLAMIPTCAALALACAASLAVVSPAVAQTAPAAPPVTLAPAPEGATGRQTRSLETTTRYMVAAANPLAANAGRQILRAGGSAVDAAIAVQLVLNIVEPQSSGIGGGAFLVLYDAGRRQVTTMDGRETAPMAARPDRFMGADGKPIGFMAAVVGGRSVGVPGLVRLMEDAHKAHGKLPWARLFEPALTIADDGFAISPRFNGLLSQEQNLQRDPRARALYFDADGKPKPIGTVLKSPALARTLRAIQQGGADVFYGGAIAQDIVDTVTGHAANPGDITLADLSAYRTVTRDPICGRYRAFRVCGMGPPSSGAIALQQMLGILETADLARMGPGAEAAHWLAEAGRLAFADRSLYLADPAFVPVPTEGLIDPAYLASRRALIDPARSMGAAKPGEPPRRRTFHFVPSVGASEFGTSHISIIDAAGNAVSMTTTIEAGFGARIMTESGFLLNNQLTDFEFQPMRDGQPVANRVEPGKRPRSSMTPTLVFDAHGRLYAVLGSPGGSLIINFVAKTLVALIDWRMDPQAAVDLANFGSRNGPTELEAGSEILGWQAGLEAKGHTVRAIPMTSGTQVVLVTPEGFSGGSDSRREGVAIGD